MAHGSSSTSVGAIKLTNVAKEHLLANGERLRVLENVSFEAPDRSFTSILGPSGCGKSTILNLIARLDNHSSGTVSVGGNRIGFVFQQPRLLNWRTVEDNVLLPLEGQQFERGLARKYLALVGLGGNGSYYQLQLSGGMQQRMSIAKAIAIDHGVILKNE